MIPTFVGLFIVLGTLGLIGLGLVLVIVGRLQRQRTLPTIGIRLAGFALAGYALAWVAGVAIAPQRVLAIGQEVSFCGLDCHLHVSVARVERARRLAVVVRFRSDAIRALEYPGDLRIAVRDAAGRLYPPTSGFVAEPLRPGETLERDFEFNLPEGAAAPRLTVAHDGWLDYLMPGRANPIAQRRIGLDLGRE
jgi:hypothetical protein